MFYSIGESIKNVIALAYTKIMWTNARLIRLPFYARNKKNIIVSEGFTCGYSCRITAGGGTEGKVRIGKNVIMGDNCQLEGIGGIDIEDNVLMASKIYIGTTAHGSYKGEAQSAPNIAPNDRPVVYAPVHIKENVWIGNQVSILPGVIIGKGAVIGANSVVTKNIQDNCIAVGIPAKEIKRYDFETGEWTLMD